jgi:hypothetical protein
VSPASSPVPWLSSASAWHAGNGNNPYKSTNVTWTGVIEQLAIGNWSSLDSAPARDSIIGKIPVIGNPATTNAPGALNATSAGARAYVDALTTIR